MQMTGYTKLFGCIVASTIWREPHETRIVWITMLALADKNGIVASSLPGLADMARVTIAECQVALRALEAPDEYSRTKDFEGRRIEPCDGGWTVLNHAKYRAKMGADERREYMRIKQQESRERRKGSSNSSQTKSKKSKVVKARQGSLAPSTHAEAQSDAEATPTGGAASGVHQQFVERWMKYYEERYGARYAFQGGRDGKAVKTLIAHFKEADNVAAFIGKCHAREHEGYIFENTKTLSDIATNISKLQAALAQPPKSPKGQPPRREVPAEGEQF